MTLAELKVGQDAVLRTIGGQGELRHHLLDMGLTPGTEVTLRKVAPMGDPIEVELRGYELTLRLADAENIEIADERAPAPPVGPRHSGRHAPQVHPGAGEMNARHREEEHGRAAIPDGTPLVFALAGNQNCGKTTLFNQLTGSNQHVGNFPGVTVDRKDGQVRGHAEVTVTEDWLQSRSKNSAWLGQTLTGAACDVFVAGRHTLTNGEVTPVKRVLR